MNKKVTSWFFLSTRNQIVYFILFDSMFGLSILLFFIFYFGFDFVFAFVVPLQIKART